MTLSPWSDWILIVSNSERKRCLTYILYIAIGLGTLDFNVLGGLKYIWLVMKDWIGQYFNIMDKDDV
jgi:hypothetical protein